MHAEHQTWNARAWWDDRTDYTVHRRQTSYRGHAAMHAEPRHKPKSPGWLSRCPAWCASSGGALRCTWASRTWTLSVIWPEHILFDPPKPPCSTHLILLSVLRRKGEGKHREESVHLRESAVNQRRTRRQCAKTHLKRIQCCMATARARHHRGRENLLLAS